MVLLKEVNDVKSIVRGKLFQTLTIRWLKNCERQLVEQDAFANLYGWPRVYTEDTESITQSTYSSCLRHLLPPPRDQSLISRLRSS